MSDASANPIPRLAPRPASPVWIRFARLDLALLALAVAATAGWLVLYRWYSLFDNHDSPYFAFEKIRGGRGEPVMSEPLRWTVAVFVGLGLAFALGFVALARARVVTRVAKAAVVLAGLGPGLVNVGLFPVGALDVFRYMVALKQYYFYHENPYLQGFMHHQDDPFATHAFYLHLPNAKGPSWLLVSAIPSYLAGFDDPVRFLVSLKLFNLLLIGLTAWLIARALPGERRRWLAVYLFAANPLVLFEGVGNVHNDVLGAAFLVGALIAVGGRSERRSSLALPLLALSALVKYFTLQLAPLVLAAMLARRRRWRAIALSAVGAVVVSAAVIAPFWSGGDMIQGVNRVGDRYEQSAHVSLISLVRQHRQVGLAREAARAVPAEQPFFALLFGLLALPIAWRVWRRGRPIEPAVVDCYLLFLLLLTLLYPWYLIPVAAVFALQRDALDLAFLFVATLLGLVYYPAYVWAHFGSGYGVLRLHQYLALFVTAPIVAYLVVRLARRLAAVPTASA